MCTTYVTFRTYRLRLSADWVTAVKQGRGYFLSVCRVILSTGVGGERPCSRPPCVVYGVISTVVSRTIDRLSSVIARELSLYGGRRVASTHGADRRLSDAPIAATSRGYN